MAITIYTAYLDPFVWHDSAGHVHFANRMSGAPWPVFRPQPRRRRRRQPYDHANARLKRAILRGAQITAARRWMPVNPLLAHQMRIEAILAQRRRPARLT